MLPLAGDWTLATFCDHLAGLDPFPRPPQREVSRRYRAWTFESAALDLALRQAGRALHEVARPGAPARPLRRLDAARQRRRPVLDRPAATQAGPLPRRCASSSTPPVDWDDALVEALAATGAVDSVDFKGHYTGTVVDAPPDPALYRARAARAARGVDRGPPRRPRDHAPARAAPRPRQLGRADPLRRRHPRPAVPAADGQCQAVAPGPAARAVGRLRRTARPTGSACTAAASSSSGRARGQIQYLASLFHPDGPNDVAPGGFNDPEPSDGLPTSPLPPQPSRVGFRWG